MSQSETTSIEIRDAVPGDEYDLAGICRQCLPASPRWQTPAYAIAWWRRTLRGDVAVTGIAKSAERTAGFITLVTDEHSWLRLEGERRPRGWKRFTAMPALFRPQVLREYLVQRRRRRLLVEHPTEPEPVLPPEERVWLELIGVDPTLQGRGLGGQLLRWADERAIELGRRGIRARVDVDNAPTRRIDERNGYIFHRFQDGRCTYTKLLEPPDRNSTQTLDRAVETVPQ